MPYERKDFLLLDVRLSLASLFTPFVNREDPTSKPNYHADLIFPRTHPQFEEIQQRIREAADKKWGAQGPAEAERLSAQDKLCIHKGDVTRAGKEAYAGLLFISANSKTQPDIIATENGKNLKINDNPAHPLAPYSGCWVNAHIDIWGMVHPKAGKRICAGLLGIQFLRHDARIGATAPSSINEFGVVAAGADAAAPSTGGGGLI